MATRVIGFYSKGCIAGAVEMPANGETWQVMRLSRNRNWGHPELIKFLERFAPLAAKATGWHGILVGDMAQPRGGPLPFGHASHQIGLDVDIWFMPMPDHERRTKEREEISAAIWSPPTAARQPEDLDAGRRRRFIKTAAEQPERRAHLRQCRDQEGIMPRGEARRAGWPRCGRGTATTTTSTCA